LNSCFEELINRSISNTWSF